MINEIFQKKTFKNKYFYLFLVYLLVMLYLYVPIFILGPERTLLEISDVMNQELNHRMMFMRHHVFFHVNEVIDEFIPGYKVRYFPFSVFSLYTLIYSVFHDLFWTYIGFDMFMRIFAFWGVVRMVAVIDSVDEKKYNTPILLTIILAVIASIYPGATNWGLHVYGIPFLFSTMMLMVLKKDRWYDWLYIIFFAFCSHFLLSGIVMLFYAGVFWIYQVSRIYIKDKEKISFGEKTKKHLKDIFSHFFFANALLGFLYVCIESPMLYTMLLDKNYESQRALVFSQVPGYSIHNIILYSLPFIFVIISFIFFIRILSGKSRFKLSSKTTVYFCLCLLFLNLYYLGEYVTWWAYQCFFILRLNLANFLILWILPIFLVKWIDHIGSKRKIIYHFLVYIGTFLALVPNQWFPMTKNILMLNQYLKGNDSYYYPLKDAFFRGFYPSYIGYTTPFLWEKIEKDLGESYQGYRVAPLGITPAQPTYYGVKVYGGYISNIPLEFYKDYLTLIEPEMEKLPEDIKKNFFNVTIGAVRNMTLLFTSDFFWISPPYDAYAISKEESDKFGSIKNLEWNMEILRKYDVKYIYSAFEIGNYKDLDLKFIKKYDDPRVSFYVYVYQIN